MSPCKTLVLFSGGLDSTYVMYKLLSETEDEITAVLLETANGSTNKISSPKDQNRHVLNIVNELKKIRDFDYVVKQVWDDEYDEEVMNHYYTYFVAYAAPFINSKTFDRLVTGRTWEQFNKKLVETEDKRIGNPSYFATIRLMTKLTRRGYLWNPLITHDFHDHFNRWHVFKYLPDNLKTKTFSCNSPIKTEEKNKPCKECYKCLWDELVNIFKENGSTAAQVEDFRRKKCREYGISKKDAPMRFWLPLFMKKGRIFDDLDTKEKIQKHIGNPNLPHYSVPKKFADDPESIWYMNDLSDIKNIEDRLSKLRANYPDYE
jgi:7-cyano-7-deazaguanine synthase in queuosine biosynthesis